ncbi:SusD family protein [bacterium A37T11]|nr:SusD family protein [bacterium A37T11]
MKNKFIYILISIVLMVGSACKKYLDLKPDKTLVIPETTNDLQGLLDGPLMYSNSPVSGQAASDNYYINDANFNSLNITYRNLYIWGEPGTFENDWSGNYRNIQNINLILEYIDKVTANTQNEREFIKGQAYFMRAFNLLNLSQIFTLPYSEMDADKTLGLPIKLSSDINSPTVRANLRETFSQIINDFKKSAQLLPIESMPLTRANRKAAFAALARTNLIMGNYQDSRDYADSCLLFDDSLIDFNTLDSNFLKPIMIYNKEVYLQNESAACNNFSKSYSKVDTILYQSYAPNDLRRGVFYKKNTDKSYYFKGGYDGNISSATFFSGFAIDEMYLIKAECEARLNNTATAIDILNKLLKNRYSKKSFIPFTATDSEGALRLIIAERTKELAFRNGLRWIDLRRLNSDPRFSQTITRVISGQTFTLAPNDLRYAFLIPTSVIQLSGIEQNAR